jgi:hypothetical protein
MHGHFGDTWALTSYLLSLSEKNGSPILFSDRDKDVNEIILDITPHLNSKGKIIFSNSEPTIIFKDPEPYRKKFIPTIKKWSETNSKIIAYQFDGRHQAEKKNLPKQNIENLINSLVKLGYHPIDVGNYKSISFIVDTLSKCQLFVGCASGLSVVTRSVGCPTFIISWKIKEALVDYLVNCQLPHIIRFFKTENSFLNYLTGEGPLIKFL